MTNATKTLTPDTLLCFKVSDNDGLICIISDHSLTSAIAQAKDEVAETFDVSAHDLRIEQVEPASIYGGKPVYQHLLACSDPIPQRIFDAR